MTVLDLPVELLDRIFVDLLPPPGQPADEDADEVDTYRRYRRTLAALSLVCRRFHAVAKPRLYRSLYVRGQSIDSLCHGLETASTERDRLAVREVIFPLVHPLSSCNRRAVTPSGVDRLIRLLPGLWHVFFYDFRLQTFPSAELASLGRLQHLRKVSFYIGSLAETPQVLPSALRALASCPGLRELELDVDDEAPAVDDRDLEVPTRIERLTLITSRSLDLRFDAQPSFSAWIVGRLSPSLRYLATNVGDDLCSVLDPVASTLVGLSMTPFTEWYERGWWHRPLPSLRILSLGFKGWDRQAFDPSSAPACREVEIAVIGGYDFGDKRVSRVAAKVASLPRLRRVVVTEADEPRIAEVFRKEIGRRRKAAGKGEVPVDAVLYGEVDLQALLERDVVVYKYAPM